MHPLALAFIAGMTACAEASKPLELTRNASSRSPGVTSSTVPQTPEPALYTSTST